MVPAEISMLESDIKTLLTARHEDFVDKTRSHIAVDFHLPRRSIYFDAKEKRQKFSARNWAAATPPERHLFIVDDLAVRKLLAHAPNSFCLIRDSSSPQVMHYVYSIVDFLCIPKQRCRRPIERNVRAMKGKWLVDLRDAAAFVSLADAVDYIFLYPRKKRVIFERHIDCWGNYPSEEILTAGALRTPRHWKEDATPHG
jgi:hypothetical protein